MAVKLYHWVRCSTCRQARELLKERGLAFDEQDFFAVPLGRDELLRLAELGGGIRNLVSIASPSFKRDGRSLEDYTDDQLLGAMMEEPRMLRRPMLVTDDARLLIGKKAIEAELAARPG